MTAQSLRIETPEKLAFLYKPKRYKVLYGGRGGAKSTGVADAAVVTSFQQPLRWLCARETMKSLSDSVHQILEDRIKHVGLSDFYNAGKAEITGRNGSSFVFAGLKHNVSNIKSLEGIDRVWVEEAATVSKHSWQTLIPTIRKDGSEIWVTFNPELSTDDTYQRFVVHPPPNCETVRISWRDNPWFPAVLEEERRHLQSVDPEAYAHVWEGECISHVEGAIYASELRAAADRITRVPYLPGKPVYCSWDLGFGDAVAIWFFQGVGLEWHFIDYLESRQKPLGWYLKEMQGKPYLYGTQYLPWDGAAAELGTGKSIEEQMRKAGHKVQVVKRMQVTDAISYGRTMFPLCWFDSDKCADGLQALRHYQWGLTASTGREAREPLHNWASHGADAYRTAAVGVSQPIREQQHQMQTARMEYSSWA